MKRRSFEPKFVEYVPEAIEDGALYISITYATAVHKCFCGCGQEVVTPLGPTDWELRFDGSVSLYPSVGSWALKCQSHYWLRRNKVIWARRWSPEQIDVARRREHEAKKSFFESKKDRSDGEP
jgi:hypothetical protein